MMFHFIFPRWPKIEEQSPFNLPPLGVLQAASCVPGDVDVEITDENVRPVDFDAACDLVGVSIMLTCQAPRAYEIAAEMRRRGRPVVLGGLHVTLCPEEAALHADAIVVGEGEGLIERMTADFAAGRMQKVYRRDGFPDIAAVPAPNRRLHDKKKHYTFKGWELVDLVETSRGCRFNCYPCCSAYLGGRQHRTKPVARTLEDLAGCHDHVFIVDNSLEQSVEYQKELFGAMIGAGKRWVSHPISADPEVLRLARKSGCWYIYYAVFSTSDKVRDRIKLYHDHGIGVEGTILLGLDFHTEDFVKRLIDFLLTVELDLAEFTILTPFPRTQAYEQLEEEGRIIDRDWSRYNASTVVYRPFHMSPERLTDLYREAWRTFYAKDSQNARMGKLLLKAFEPVPAHLR